MRQVKRLWLVVLVLLFVMPSLSGCSTTQMPTPRHSYASYLAKWNDMMDSYRFHYEMQTPETQAKWDEKIQPTIEASSKALDAWGGSPNSYDKEQAFLALEREALRLFALYAIPERREVGQ